jgi:hypothetical protein
MLSLLSHNGSKNVGYCYVSDDNCIIGMQPFKKIVPVEVSNKVLAELEKKKQEMISNGTYLFSKTR